VLVAEIAVVIRDYPQPDPKMRRFLRLLPALLLSAPLGAQSAKPSIAPPKPPAAIKAIRESDIKRDLYALASDDMRGREAGTIDEMRASMWLAEEMRKIGLAPKGDMGSWFQWWNMRRSRISTTSSSVKLAGRPLTLWTDITPATNAAVDVLAPTIFVSNISDTTVDVRGKIAVADSKAPPELLGCQPFVKLRGTGVVLRRKQRF